MTSLLDLSGGVRHNLVDGFAEDIQIVLGIGLDRGDQLHGCAILLQ